LEDTLLAEGKMRETILVAPDGNGPVYRFSEWANAFDGRQQMEDAIAFDLVRYIDAHYRTLGDPADRAIGGNSEGGYGAVDLALHHPDVFGAAVSVGGFFEIESGHPGIFGEGPRSTTYQLYYSPSRYVQTADGAQAAQALRFVIGVGTQDGSLYQDGVNFYHTLSRENVTAQLVSVPGSHTWLVWRGQMAVAFQAFESWRWRRAPGSRRSSLSGWWIWTIWVGAARARLSWPGCCCWWRAPSCAASAMRGCSQ
jgi:enterochelin esterase-like enzyme